jgi:hypothetical protein
VGEEVRSRLRVGQTGEPRQGDREGEHEQRPDHELRQGQPHERQDRRGPIGGTIAEYRSDHPHEQHHRDVQDEGVAAEPEGVLERLIDHVAHRRAADERRAEVALDGVLQPDPVTLVRRPVEMQLFPELGALGRRRLTPEHLRGDVAGDYLRHREDQSGGR